MRTCHKDISIALQHTGIITCMLWDLGDIPKTEIEGVVREVVDYDKNQYVDSKGCYWLNAVPYTEFLNA